MRINKNVNLHSGNMGAYIHTCARVNDRFIHSSMHNVNLYMRSAIADVRTLERMNLSFTRSHVYMYAPILLLCKFTSLFMRMRAHSSDMYVLARFIYLLFMNPFLDDAS